MIEWSPKDIQHMAIIISIAEIITLYLAHKADRDQKSVHSSSATNVWRWSAGRQSEYTNKDNFLMGYEIPFVEDYLCPKRWPTSANII